MSLLFPAYVTTGTTSTSIAGDSTITSVTLLLHGDGDNNSNNNTFVDSSTNNATITRTGTPTQGSINPFGSNWSNYFNGSTDYFLVGSTVGILTPLTTTGAFMTIEAWVYATSLRAGNANDTHPSIVGLGAVYMNFGVANGTPRFMWYNGAITYLDSTIAVTVNTWNHLAVVFNGSGSNNLKIYVNGVLGGTGTFTNISWGSGAGGNNLYIGAVGNNQATSCWPGYISNVRITNSALYTSTFTPSTTPLTTVTNTVLLTCATNRVRDISTVSNTITVNGSVSVQRFAPFSTSTSYSASTTATVYSGSIYFNGSSDYLTSTQPAAFGTSDFTIELWFYDLLTSAGFYPNLISTALDYTTAGGIRIGFGPNTRILSVAVASSAVISTTVTYVGNTWNHVALTKIGTTLTVYLNGVSIGTSAGFSTNLSANSIVLGNVTGAGGPYYFTGYMSNVRIIRGAGIYTGNFTPSAVPLTATTNTQYLMLGTNGGIIDTTMQNNLTTVGDAKISTTQSKFGGSSMYFDGTGDYLSIPSNPTFAFGSGDYTVECWIYSQSTAQQVLFASGGTGVNNFYFSFVPTSSFIGIGTQNAWILQATGLTLSTSVWYHVAASRSSGTLRLFLNGTQVASGADSTVWIQGGYTAIGSNAQGSQYTTGYIDDLRITNGVARYTANFTAPTVAFVDAAIIVFSTATTTYTTVFTTTDNVYLPVVGTTTSTGGTSYYTTSTGLFTGTSAIHIFAESGFFTATQNLSVRYLVVAGGGGGANLFGGGGGGGLLTGTFTATLGVTYAITVGSGGSGGTASSASPVAGSRGGYSSITSGTTVITTATGGGGGGANSVGLVGGSGGGGGDWAGQAYAGGAGTPGQGNPGGAGAGNDGHGGGGGGAGASGVNGITNFGGAGGAGLSSNITGTATYYAGGGGGGVYTGIYTGAVGGVGGIGGGGASGLSSSPSGGASGTPGTSGTGGGGGGGTRYGQTVGGGSGGPGIVVLSYSYTAPSTVIIYTGTTITYNYVNGRWATRPYNTSTTDISTAIFTGGINTATSAFALSVGTTAQRTIPQQSGALRFNSSLNAVESYSTLSNTWTTVALGALPYAVEYLAIGAGGSASSVSGGGAGGVLAGFTQLVTGTSYTVAVGQGGSGTGGDSYIAPTAIATINSSSAIAYAYGGSTGTTFGGGSSGGGIAGQGYPVAQALYTNLGTGGVFYTTLTGEYPGESAAVHVFTASGFFTATQTVSAKYLVVAGGGGGGNGAGIYGSGGGGGAGGLVTGTATMPAGTTYTITVGGGGTGGTTNAPSGGNGTSGNPSGISGTGLSVPASGGGKGAPGGGAPPYGSPCAPTWAGQPGGSGGGGNPAGCGIPGQGFPGGGYGTGGYTQGSGNGGGAGGAGGLLAGLGLTFNYEGSSATYAAGGYGGPNANPTLANTPGYGNGGRGGSWSPTPSPGNGGNPGIVVITYRYALPQLAGGGAISSTGTGIYSQVTGAQVTYGAGGTASSGSPGGTNTGNGGSAPNGTGAPGVVYIRYPGSQKGSGGSVSTVGTYTLHTFVSTGTYTA